MLKIAFRRRTHVFWFALIFSAIVTQLGHAQSPQAYSNLFPGSSNLTGLPGQNVAQQMMAQSINNFCPTVASIAMPTPGQKALSGLCGAMIGNALQVLGQPPNSNLGTPFSLDANGLNNALQQLNGGAELLVRPARTR